MNMKDIIVISRREAERFSPEDPIAVISIRCPWDSRVKFNKPVPSVLHLEFHDITGVQYDKILESRETSRPTTTTRRCRFALKLVLFDRRHAAEILDFVDTCLELGYDRFMVHCAAGISRSPGVAVALQEIYMGIKDVPTRWNLYNRTVYSEIMKEWADRQELLG